MAVPDMHDALDMSPVTAQTILELVTRTSKLNDALRLGQSVKGPPSYASALALYDRCCSLLGAIRVLLTCDFVHEAIILARPLFTDSLALTEMAAADDKGRDEFAVRLNMTGVAQGEGVFRSARANGGDVDHLLRALAEERAEIEEYARRKGLSAKGWQPDEQAKELADKQGRSGEYVDMRVTDQFVHGSTKATSQRFQETRRRNDRCRRRSTGARRMGESHGPFCRSLRPLCDTGSLPHLWVDGTPRANRRLPNPRFL
jgi:hypothetical protein